MSLFWLISAIIFYYAELQVQALIDPCNLDFYRNCPDPRIKFFLFTKNHTDIPETVEIGSNATTSNLYATAYNSSKPTKIIIHGYSETMNISSLLAIRNEYLKTRDYNIFTVDWASIIETRIQTCYIDATWTTRHVGNCSSQLYQRLRETGAADIHVIGFSLGAQVLNFMAINLRPHIMKRITGLDPALPLFLTPNNDDKLDKSDAEFVDVYHTDAYIYGQAEQTGHVDFYMNRGTIQPGCWNTSITETISCSHNRAPFYYAESINSRIGFWGWSCPWFWNSLVTHCLPHDPLILMGDMVDKTARGIYYVDTNSTSPYALGKYNLE